MGPALLGPDETKLYVGAYVAGPPETNGIILVIDLATFDLSVVPLPFENEVQGLALDGATLLVVGDRADALSYFDTGSSVVTARADLPSSVSISTGDVVADPSSDRVYVATPTENATIYIVSRHEVAAMTTVFQADFLPLNMLRLGDTILVGAAHVDDRRSALWRISRELDGVIPGRVDVGPGVIGTSLEAPDGTLLLTLPWVGEVARVTPR